MGSGMGGSGGGSVGRVGVGVVASSGGVEVDGSGLCVMCSVALGVQVTCSSDVSEELELEFGSVHMWW